MPRRSDEIRWLAKPTSRFRKSPLRERRGRGEDLSLGGSVVAGLTFTTPRISPRIRLLLEVTTRQRFFEEERVRSREELSRS